MSIDAEQSATSGYELVDDDREPFDAFTEADFEDWLRVGLEGFLLEDQGAWAFPGAEGPIARQDDLVLGLREAYREWPAGVRGRFRRALAKVIASLEPSERYVPLFEHLLSLAAALPVPEILRVLPARVGNGFFGQVDGRGEEDLFGDALLTVARLAAPREEAVECLHGLIGSKYFDDAYAGIALTALCRADDRGLVRHMELLRASLASMFRKYATPASAQRELARSIMDATSLPALAGALPRLKYFDVHEECAPLDRWLVECLLGGKSAPLICTQNEDGRLAFHRRGKPRIKEPLAEEGSGFTDLIELLQERGYISASGSESPVFPAPATADAWRLGQAFGLPMAA